MSRESKPNDDALEALRIALLNLKYGSVEVTVHEGRIVQIERKEKQRFGTDSIRKAGQDWKGGAE